jgi:hypothetical protein
MTEAKRMSEERLEELRREMVPLASSKTTLHWQGILDLFAHIDYLAAALSSATRVDAIEMPLIEVRARAIVKAWERLGSCIDEVGAAHCGEYEGALDDAIIALRALLAAKETE